MALDSVGYRKLRRLLPRMGHRWKDGPMKPGEVPGSHKYFQVLTICGSMRYYDQMLLAASEYTAGGWIVLMPFVQYNNGVKLPGDPFAQQLADMHIAKMAMSQAIVVIGEHRGESTTAEMQWAREHGLTVLEDNNWRG